MRQVPRVDRMGGLVLAMLAGILVPAAIVAALAARDPLPRDCRTGQATTTAVEGALLYSGGQDLWYSEGLPGKPRKLIDFAPPRPRVLPRATPSPGASATPSASPSPRPSASASPTPTPHLPRVLAADISVDRKLVALLVVDPPGHIGAISLMLLSPLDAPGTAPVVAWTASADRGNQRDPTVRVLDNGKVLFLAPVAPASLPTASPAPSHPPSPSPSPSPTRPPSPSPSISAGVSPGPSVSRATASPSASPSPSPAVAAVVVAPSPAPTIVAQGPEGFFIAEGHSAWPDTKSYRVPRPLPRVEDRVDGPGSRVAGRLDREVGTPLGRRHLNEVLVGRAGQASIAALCTAGSGTVPTGFSPDEGLLVLADGQDSLVLDLSGTHAATRLLSGRLLAWR